MLHPAPGSDADMVAGERCTMSHERAITIRRLSENDLRRAQGIDVSEDGQSLYRYSNGELTPEPREWHRPAWDAPQWEDKITAWAQVLRWDVVIGAFDGATLIGMASLRYRLTETVAQLVSLHVSRAYRRHGVATRLLHELMRLARRSEARELYVSAAPTPSAIGFYTRHGFAPTARVNQRLYDLEPEDIHMTLTL
jgi:ribosomal protein S18 acetylase RimI-like enzyme